MKNQSPLPLFLEVSKINFDLFEMLLSPDSDNQFCKNNSCFCVSRIISDPMVRNVKNKKNDFSYFCCSTRSNTLNHFLWNIAKKFKSLSLVEQGFANEVVHLSNGMNPFTRTCFRGITEEWRMQGQNILRIILTAAFCTKTHIISKSMNEWQSPSNELIVSVSWQEYQCHLHCSLRRKFTKQVPCCIIWRPIFIFFHTCMYPPSAVMLKLVIATVIHSNVVPVY